MIKNSLPPKSALALFLLLLGILSGRTAQAFTAFECHEDVICDPVKSIPDALECCKCHKPCDDSSHVNAGFQTCLSNKSKCPTAIRSIFSSKEFSKVSKPVYNVVLCGDGKVDPGEVCDDAHNAQGNWCSDDCQEHYSVQSQTPSALCGNGIIEVGESCDPPGTVYKTGYQCDDSCHLECATMPSRGHCGNGILDCGEACDPNLDTGVSCLPDCTIAISGSATPNEGLKVYPLGDIYRLFKLCGNGHLERGEGCDDGNTKNGDGCSSSCQKEPVLGQPPLPVCGDGVAVAGEQCDDGNTSNGDGCNSACKVEFCGDGIMNNGGVESCDDGDSDNADACLNNCVPASCGDGYVQAGVEECDDGNLVGGDGCNPTCKKTGP